MNPVVVAVAITGSVPRKKDNPAVPILPSEQIESTHAAFEAGATLAHIHVRLNATQVHNAIRKTIGMEAAPDDPAHRRSYLASIGRLLDSVQPDTINFGSGYFPHCRTLV